MIPQGRQSPEHPGYVATDVAYDCAQCVRWHGAKYQFPALQPLDHEAWGLMLLLQDQQRIGMEPIGLDYGVLPAVFEMKGIPREQWSRLFDQLVALNHGFQAHYGEEREKRRKADEAKRRAGGRG